MHLWHLESLVVHRIRYRVAQLGVFPSLKDCRAFSFCSPRHTPHALQSSSIHSWTLGQVAPLPSLPANTTLKLVPSDF
jgi:hypothetical protein